MNKAIPSFGQWPKWSEATWTLLRFFFLSDDENIILSLEFGGERDLGNYLFYWGSAHKGMTWPVLVTDIPGTAVKHSSSSG